MSFFSPSYDQGWPDPRAYSTCECGNALFVRAVVRTEYWAWLLAEDGQPWREDGLCLRSWTSTGVFRCTACNRLLTQPREAEIREFKT